MYSMTGQRRTFWQSAQEKETDFVHSCQKLMRRLYFERKKRTIRAELVCAEQESDRQSHAALFGALFFCFAVSFRIRRTI